jgi:hypothetical protein
VQQPLHAVVQTAPGRILLDMLNLFVVSIEQRSEPSSQSVKQKRVALQSMKIVRLQRVSCVQYNS